MKKKRARQVVSVETDNNVALINNDSSIGTVSSNQGLQEVVNTVKDDNGIEEESNVEEQSGMYSVEAVSEVSSILQTGGGQISSSFVSSVVSQPVTGTSPVSLINGTRMDELTIADELRKKSMMYNSDAAKLKLQQRLKNKGILNN